MDERPRRLSRIGAWRLLDIAHASMSFRSLGFSGGVMPELGPPDVIAPPGDPDEELPGSNIDEGEQQRAMERERARRWLTGAKGKA